MVVIGYPWRKKKKTILILTLHGIQKAIDDASRINMNGKNNRDFVGNKNNVLIFE